MRMYMQELPENLKVMVPSWYGDLRLEAMGKSECRLIVEQATVQEMEALKKLQAHAVKKGWCSETTILGQGAANLLAAPIAKVTKVLVKVLKPGRETVSAIRIAGGKIEEIHQSVFEDDGEVPPSAPYRGAATPDVGRSAALAKAEPVKAEVVERPAVATTVAKPERGCPPPDFPPAELKARAVLSSFLNDEQCEDFRAYNRFVSVGGSTGHRYMVTSRHAVGALRTYQRSLYDLDEERAICTHDHSVPAAEELLALHLLVTLPGHEEYLRGMDVLGFDGGLV